MPRAWHGRVRLSSVRPMCHTQHLKRRPCVRGMLYSARCSGGVTPMLAKQYDALRSVARGNLANAANKRILCQGPRARESKANVGNVSCVERAHGACHPPHVHTKSILRAGMRRWSFQIPPSPCGPLRVPQSPRAELNTLAARNLAQHAEIYVLPHMRNAYPAACPLVYGLCPITWHIRPRRNGAMPRHGPAPRATGANPQCLCVGPVEPVSCR